MDSESKTLVGRSFGFGLLVMTTMLVAQAPAKPLEIYFVDTEGGQATLFVSPSGESLLVDTGNPGGRDTDRIMAAVADAKLKQIDYVVLTHYHGDHVGGVPELASRIPLRHFFDHGASVEAVDRVAAFHKAYPEIHGKGKHTVVKPGDKVPIAGLDWLIVTAGGKALAKSAGGGGAPNPACASFKRRDDIPNDENGQSVGSLITFGKFRMVDLGDLLWNNESDLMCPANRIGRVDVYLTSHHGLDISGSAALVHGLRPRVAIMNNGPRKGGMVPALEILHRSPGLEDLWQLHWSHFGKAELNAPGMFIANLDEPEALAAVLTAPKPPAVNPAHSPAYWIRMSVQRDGTFTVTNSRNGFAKRYSPS